MTKKPIFVRSVNTDALLTVLLGANPGDFIPYDDLAKVIGQDVRRGKAFGWLSTARRIALRDNRVVFLTEHGRGLRRATDSDVIAHANQRWPLLRRAVHRIDDKVCAAKTENLTPEDKVKAYSVRTRLALADAAFSTKASKAIDDAVRGANMALPPARTLALFENGAIKV